MVKCHLFSSIYHLTKLFVYTHPNKFLDWLDKIEHWFLFWLPPKEEQVSFTASRLTISVSEWWYELQISQLEQGKCKIQLWNRMKYIMRSEFIPLNYCLV